MKKTVLLCFGCILFFFGCRKEKEPETERLDPEGMKYIQLRPNQFFIYKDSATGKTDSVVVTETVLAAPVVTENWGLGQKKVKKEVYHLTLTKKTGTSDSIWIQGAATSGVWSLLPEIILYGNQTEYFRYPANLNMMAIEGIEYSDVIVATNVYSDYTRVYYWAPLVGLIKVTKTDRSLPRQTFTLLRHN